MSCRSTATSGLAEQCVVAAWQGRRGRRPSSRHSRMLARATLHVTGGCRAN